MKLYTSRLEIIPLSYSQLKLYIQENGLLEMDLGLELIPREVPAELAEAFTITILPAVKTASNHLFSTLWTIVLKEQNVMVGDLCFKGTPNNAGEVEIGYGTYDQFQGKGYMTEAISAITDWALSQKGVKVVVAGTNVDNIASQRVLEKCGFASYKNTDEMIWWKFEKVYKKSV